jgi:hypothetical protein
VTGVGIGASVAWDTHPARRGTDDPTPPGRGTVLDRGPKVGTWWCSTGTGHAVLVKANKMQTPATV